MHEGGAVRANLGFGWGMSSALDPDAAAIEAAGQAGERVGSTEDVTVAFVFASGGHAGALDRVARIAGEALESSHVLGCSAAGVVGGATEAESGSHVAVLAARLPGTRITPFTDDELRDLGLDTESASLDAQIRRRIGFEDDLKASIVMGDPRSLPLGRLLPRLSGLRAAGPDGARAGALLGGLASAGQRAGEDILIVDDRVHRGGLVGLSIGGPVRVDTLVSQGCRPIGESAVITRAKGNMIFELGGRPALHVAKDALDTLDDPDRRLLSGGLFIGRAVSEYKERLGRGDFLIRNVVGAEQSSGALAASDLFRAGQTVQFHIRDATTAREDLELLLDGQVLHGPPAGALLFTCNGRGRRLFDEPNVDASVVQRSFAQLDAGEQAAKTGSAIQVPPENLVPLAGMFAAGELGPVGGETFLHGHSACLALFRAEEPGAGRSPGA